MTEKTEEKTTDSSELGQEIFKVAIGQQADVGTEKSRTVALYEDLNEESASMLVGSLMYLHENGCYEEPEEVENEEGDGEEEVTYKKVWEPIRVVVSSHGGVAHEMFSVYDTMRMIKKDCEIETLGLGKVMSAAVLLLAAGTKGKRKIGMNCRVMLHPVAGGAIGDVQDIENDTAEMKKVQKQYIKCLAQETNLTEKRIRRIMKKKLNCYISAEEAVEMGIADEII